VAKIADDSNFDDVLNENALPALVDFWAPWCKPCHALSPILDEVESAGDLQFRLVKVNADEATKTAARFNVRSLPTLVLMSKGQAVSRKIGALSRTSLEQWLRESLGAA
jgi:thioredoxin